jgi:hypothetical protein
MDVGSSKGEDRTLGGCNMRVGPIVVAAVMATACSSSSGGPPSLDGNWFYADSAGTSGVGVSFKNDGSYELQELVLTSSTSGNDQVEIGTFTVSGNTITVTPTQWSCKGPDAIYQLTYSFDGSNLSLAQPSGIIVMQPNNNTASSGEAIAIGCFDTAGNFTPEPLAAVSN